MLGVFCGSIFAFIEYIFAVLLQNFLLHIGLIGSENFPKNMVKIETFSSLVILMLSVAIIRSFLVFFRIYLPRIACQKFNQELRERIIATSLKDINGASVHKTIATFTDEVTRAGNSILSLVSFFTLIFSVVILAGIGFATSSLEMGVGLVTVLVAFLILKSLKSNKQKFDISSEWDKVNKRMSDGMRNSFFLHVYNLVDTEINKSRKLLDGYFQFYKKFIVKVSFETSVPSFLSVFIIIVITYSSLRMGNQEPAVLLTFFYVFLRFVQSAADLLVTVSDFNFNYSGVTRVNKWFDKYQLETIDYVQLDEISSFRSIEKIELEAESLSFSHKGMEEYLLENINFRLSEGDCLVVVGKSGSGKSTLVSLILGLLSPDSGKVKINNEDVRKLGSDLGDIIGYVGPTPYLIEGTLRENLLYPHENSIHNPSDDEIYKVLKLVDIDKRIREIGLNSRVSDNIHILSTGQKQRLTIARAILMKPKLLVLDEATSNLDVNTEKKVIEALKTVSSNSILIVITHRQAMLELASETLKL